MPLCILHHQTNIQTRAHTATHTQVKECSIMMKLQPRPYLSLISLFVLVCVCRHHLFPPLLLESVRLILFIDSLSLTHTQLITITITHTHTHTHLLFVMPLTTFERNVTVWNNTWNGSNCILANETERAKKKTKTKGGGGTLQLPVRGTSTSAKPVFAEFDTSSFQHLLFLLRSGRENMIYHHD